jgi:hypothetical protein
MKWLYREFTGDESSVGGPRGSSNRDRGNNRGSKMQAKKSAEVAAEDDSTQPLTYQLSVALYFRCCVRSPTLAHAEWPRTASPSFDTD